MLGKSNFLFRDDNNFDPRGNKDIFWILITIIIVTSFL